jgi:hypothetical protein
VVPRWETPDRPPVCRVQKLPLTDPEDRLLFILAYVKTYSLQVVQGRLFGMGQSKANQWIHVLLPVLLAALRTLGDAPPRSLAALAQRLGINSADDLHPIAYGRGAINKGRRPIERIGHNAVDTEGGMMHFALL